MVHTVLEVLLCWQSSVDLNHMQHKLMLSTKTSASTTYTILVQVASIAPITPITPIAPALHLFVMRFQAWLRNGIQWTTNQISKQAKKMVYKSYPQHTTLN